MAGKQTPEGLVQSACLQYLSLNCRLKKYYFYRQNNIPLWHNGAYRKLPKETPAGLPDSVVIRNGIYIGLEFKAPGKYLSPDQELCKQSIESVGGQYHLIRSVEQLQQMGL